MEDLDRRLADANEATKHVTTVDDALKLREHIKKMAHELATSVYPMTVRRELTKLRNETVANANRALERAMAARDLAETAAIDAQKLIDEAEARTEQ